VVEPSAWEKALEQPGLLGGQDADAGVPHREAQPDLGAGWGLG
jgi:hypothetical protein